MSSETPRVFISYTHDSLDHKKRVLELSDRLRLEGIDCHIDQYEQSPPEGWPRWMQNQIESSDFVLVVCTELYEKRFRGDEIAGRGLGAQWEDSAITQDLYDSAGKNVKFIPVLFFEVDVEFIPKPLKSAMHYRVDNEDGYEDLYRRLTTQPKTKRPPLGPCRVFENETPKSTELSPAHAAAESTVTHEGLTRDHHELSDLALIFAKSGEHVFVQTQRIEHDGEGLRMEANSDGPRTSVFLSGLTNPYAKADVGVAFGTTALYGTLISATSVRKGGKEVWHLSIRPSKDGSNSTFAEFTFNGYTPEAVAELKARAILLGERMYDGRRSGDNFETSLIQMVNQSGNLNLPIESPLPALLKQYGNDPDSFLTRARLMCALYLILTGTVEHIFSLELQMRNGNLAINFEGQRSKRYANVPALVIKVSGEFKQTN